MLIILPSIRLGSEQCLQKLDHLQNSAKPHCRGDGSVVTWGDEDWGGDCSDVRERLTKVVQLCGSGAAFAAISADGSVVTWGSAPLP